MTAFNDTFGIIGFSSENVGIDRRIYTGLTSTNPQLNVSYNGGRVDVYLNGVKLMGNHSGQSNYDYTYQSTGAGSAITLSTGVALVATDTIECVGYVSNSSNTVTTYTPSVSAGNNTFTSISHTSSDLLNVFLNGVLLDSSDYTADSSADTVAITSLASGDVVHIQVIGALDNSNFVPASGGTFSGDVGIGQSPGKKLDVGGDVRIRGDAGTLNFYRTTSPTDVATIEYNHSDSALKVWAKNKAINFSSADADQDSSHLYIKGTTGNTGIGTNDPKSRLNVSDSGGFTTLVVTDPTRNAAGEHWYFRNTGGNFYIGQATDSSGAWDSLQARVTVENGGNVIIPGDIYSTAWTDYSGSTTIGGVSGTPNAKEVHYKIIGKLLFFQFYVQGTSNANTFSFTLPKTAVNEYFRGVCAPLWNNGSSLTNGGGDHWEIKNSATVSFKANDSLTGFTNSGTKLALGQGWYQFV